MSNKERIIELLDDIPEYKIAYILAYVQGVAADENADDAYCEKLYEDYENDTDPDKDQLYSLEACKKEWGLQ